MRFLPGSLLIEGTLSEPYRILAASGAYRLVMALRRESSGGALGVVYFAFDQGEELVLWDSPSVLMSDGSSPEGVQTHALALGPMYREADGCWLPLAGLPTPWYDVTLEVEQETGETLAWSVIWKIYGGPIVREAIALSATGLEYVANLQWTIPGFRLQMPLPLMDTPIVPQIRGSTLSLRSNVWTMMAEAQDADSVWRLEAWTLPGQPRPANIHGSGYLRAVLQSSQAVQYRLCVKVLPAEPEKRGS